MSFFKKHFGRKNTAGKDSGDNSTGIFTPTVTSSFTMPAMPAPVTPAVFDPKARPANFDDPNYRPGGQTRVVFENSLLKEINTLFLFDDSGSMDGPNWTLCRQVLPVVVDAIMQNDKDGIDWYWLNHLSREQGSAEDGLAGTGYNGIQNPDYVLDIFDNRPKPEMTDLTYTGKRLKLILNCYVSLCEKRHRANEPLPKPLSIIVFTDGDANDKEDLKRTIINTVNRLDKIDAPLRQCAIQFLQVFDPDWLNDYRLRAHLEGIEEHLRQLDDDIKGICQSERDMVDTKKLNDIIKDGGFNAQTLLPVVCGALIARLDKMQSAVKSR